MPFVIAAVVIVGVISIVDLLLTYGVVRRLREHTRQLTALGAGATASLMAAKGSAVGEFSAAEVVSAAENSPTADPLAAMRLAVAPAPSAVSCLVCSRRRRTTP